MKRTESNRGQLHSIVMPAYNEAGTIEETVDAICTHLDATRFKYELIIVDDGSTDQTAEIVQGLCNRYPAVRSLYNEGPNGFGHAIRLGLAEYRGDDVSIVTSDGADSPKDIERYFTEIEGPVDCVFGSRFIEHATITNYPAFKRFINRLANRTLGLITGARYSDFTNCFKCYRRHVIDDLHPILSGHFNITIELSVGTVLAGHKFLVVPTDWRQRDAGESTFRVFRLVKPYAATLIYCLCRSYLRKSGR